MPRSEETGYTRPQLWLRPTTSSASLRLSHPFPTTFAGDPIGPRSRTKHRRWITTDPRPLRILKKQNTNPWDKTPTQIEIQTTQGLRSARRLPKLPDPTTGSGLTTPKPALSPSAVTGSGTHRPHRLNRRLRSARTSNFLHEPKPGREASVGNKNGRSTTQRTLLSRIGALRWGHRRRPTGESTDLTLGVFFSRRVLRRVEVQFRVLFFSLMIEWALSTFIRHGLLLYYTLRSLVFICSRKCIY